MHYKGKLIVKNDEGIREIHPWGTLNKLLCKETTADDSTGHAIIDVPRPDDARKMVEALDGKEFKGNVIKAIQGGHA